VRRRHLLSLCAAGLAGCAGLGEGDGGNGGGDGVSGSPTPTSTPTPTPTAAGTPTPTPVRPTGIQSRLLSTDVPVQEIAVDLLPDTVPFAHGARVEAVDVEEGSGETLVTRLTVRVRNRTERERSLYAETSGLPLPRRRLRAPSGNAIVARARFRDGAGECSGSITPTPEGTSSGAVTAASGGASRDVAPGETLTRAYRLFSAPDNPDGCFPEGRYRLRQPFVAVTDETRLRYRWGFTIEV
jgi:hypothetical protein